MFPSTRPIPEDFWRRRLHLAQAQYDFAKANYRSLLGKHKGEPREFDAALTRARQKESDALAEYERVLRIFTELALHGRMPQDQAE